VIRLEDIKTRDWSMALDGSTLGKRDGEGLGEVVQNIDDVIQCIQIILTTPKGTDPLRPDFACDIYSFLDKPITRAMPIIVREVTTAINRYEPRVKIISVRAERIGLSQLNVTLTWQPKITGISTSQRITTVVTIGG
jgi:uncharacterized protein